MGAVTTGSQPKGSGSKKKHAGPSPVLWPFKTEIRAFCTLILMMLVWVVLYVWFHWDPAIRPVDFKQSVQRSPVGYLGVTYDDALLESLFPLTMINKVKVEINTELDQARNFLIEPRRRSLRQAGVFACTTLAGELLPSDLAALGAKGDLGGAPCTGAVGMDAPSDDIYLYADMGAIISWMKNVCPKCQWQAAPEAAGVPAYYSGKDAADAPAPDAPGQKATAKAGTSAPADPPADPLDGIIAPDKRALYYFIVRQLEQQQAREAAAFDIAVTKVLGLFEGVQFNFLHLRHQGWIKELIFWSIMGVLGNTLAGLIEATRKKDAAGKSAYNPDHFMVVVPKMVLAPVISLVVVAMVFNGWLDMQINLSNQPGFLVLAFVLGYASERVNHVLRRTVNKLVAKLEFSETNFEAATTAQRMLVQAWSDVKSRQVQPATLAEAQQEASRQAMAAAGPAVISAEAPQNS